MQDYEVTDLFEVGNAAETIQAKTDCSIDEIGGICGPNPEVFDEE